MPCPAPMCWEHFALWGRDTHVYALSHSSVREALRAMGGWAGHARVCPLPHLCAGSADRCVGEIASVCPVQQLRAWIAFVLHGRHRHRASLAEPRAFPPCPAPMCGQLCTAGCVCYALQAAKPTWLDPAAADPSPGRFVDDASPDKDFLIRQSAVSMY
jgi:hypothetical protein